MPGTPRPVLSITIPQPSNNFQPAVRGTPTAFTLPKDPFVIGEGEDMTNIPLDKTYTPPPPYTKPAKPHQTGFGGVGGGGGGARGEIVTLEQQVERLKKPWSAMRKTMFAFTLLVGIVGAIGLSVYLAKKNGTGVK